MIWTRTATRRAGRYPRGYGLPSLVVVLFLVSVLVSEIANAVSRETVEARAAAAMSGVEERLHAFEVTGGDGTGLLPHLVPSRDVSVSLVPAGAGQPAEALIETSFRPGPETALFEQQLRAFLNVPAGVPLGPVAPDEVRRKHPERVLRSGDRMGAPIDMSGDPSSVASVLNAAETRSGTGDASLEGGVAVLSGPDGSLFEAPRLIGDRVIASSLELTGGVGSETASVAGALVAPEVNTSTLQVSGLLRGDQAAVPDTRVSGTFATDSLDETDRIFFDQVNVAGLRSELVRANLLTFTDRSGPAPGPLQGEVQPVDPELIFEGRP